MVSYLELSANAHAKEDVVDEQNGQLVAEEILTLQHFGASHDLLEQFLVAQGLHDEASERVLVLEDAKVHFRSCFSNLNAPSPRAYWTEALGDQRMDRALLVLIGIQDALGLAINHPSLPQ